VELSWSTFVLEIINFLVLVWILRHFLYKPVLDVIARRRAGVEKTLENAAKLRAEAERLRAQYEGRLADWDKERQQEHAALDRELEAERVRRMADLQTALEQEREKAHVAEARRLADTLRKGEQTALLQGARFATRLLEQASGPDLEARLVEMVTTELQRLPAGRITSLRGSFGSMPRAVVVSSAFPLTDDQRQRLEHVLSTLNSQDLPVQYEQDTGLLAGVRISIGAWILGANLRDELSGFMELARDA